MNGGAPAGGLLAPVERLLAALGDPARRDRTCLWVLLAYAAAWSVYGAIAKSSQDLHFDMGEVVALSRENLIGTPKHPPFGPWLVRLWFGVFPLADWAYYTFAVLIATAGLWFAWKLSEQYLDGEKRAVGLALLTLVPFFNFLALKFNANTVLIPLWGATTWWFLRSFETRSIGYAALAGLAAAAAMLGKYWTIFLLAGLAIAALADPRRDLYFRSRAPWVTIAFGAIALTPHLVWLVINDFPPLRYTFGSHFVATFGGALYSSIAYIIGGVAYLAAPVVLLAVLARPSRATIADTLWPSQPARRTVVVAFVLPIVLPAAAAIAAKSALTPLWTMPAMALAPAILLSSPLLRFSHAAAVRMLAIAIAFPLIMIVASPFIAGAIHVRGVPNDATHYRLLAAEMEKVWRRTTEKPLRLVGGDTTLANGTVFYFPSRTSAYDLMDPALTPWVTDARIARDGIALTCRAADAGCRQAMDRMVSRHAAGQQADVEISSTYLGHTDAAGRYRIVTIPPRP